MKAKVKYTAFKREENTEKLIIDDFEEEVEAQLLLECSDCGWEGIANELVNEGCPLCGYSGIEEKEI